MPVWGGSGWERVGESGWEGVGGSGRRKSAENFSRSPMLNMVIPLRCMFTKVYVLHFHKLQGSCQNGCQLLTTWPASEDIRIRPRTPILSELKIIIITFTVHVPEAYAPFTFSS